MIKFRKGFSTVEVLLGIILLSILLLSLLKLNSTLNHLSYKYLFEYQELLRLEKEVNTTLTQGYLQESICISEKNDNWIRVNLRDDDKEVWSYEIYLP